MRNSFLKALLNLLSQLERVLKARNLQITRYNNYPSIISNSDLNGKELKEFIKLDEETTDILKLAVNKMNLSAISYYRLLKVLRTIADLNGSKEITKTEVMEALSYRVEIGG
ncbi:MAG: hypothetical protein Q9M91_04035 [Candidatus Dojkabacteria bacterium]|nr:hypothetical protein [Candidatus Dojkabacteria bacterium]MDQ7020983.1 hypothetical protein [Candidatus Dojkabacteria bacterium]